MAVIYYCVFRYVIRRFDVKTPGRTDSVSTVESKTDAELADDILVLVGGRENLSSTGACITRLRLEVKDSSLVDKEGLNALGARGVVFVGDRGIQVILGSRAQFIASEMGSGAPA